MVSLLPTKFHEILFSSFRGVALTNSDKQTDGQDKNNTSPHKSGGGGRDIITTLLWNDWTWLKIKILHSELFIVPNNSWNLRSMTSLTNAKKNILIFNINKDIIRIIESNTGDRSSSVFDYFSYTDIPPNFFFPCSEILLGCVLFGHISWNEYIWQWTSTSPFYRTIWLGKSI
jgi:hypothetical protein